jgi:hypothetical protein
MPTRQQSCNLLDAAALRQKRRSALRRLPLCRHPACCQMEPMATDTRKHGNARQASPDAIANGWLTKRLEGDWQRVAMEFAEINGAGLRYALSGKGERTMVLVNEIGFYI